MALSGREKATILLSILGAEASAKILSFLPPEMADVLVSQVNNLPRPSPAALSEVVGDFRRAMALPPSAAPREIEASTAAPREERRTFKPGDIISSVPGRTLIPLLLRERPQTIAFVLNELPEGRVAEVLTYLPEQRREVEYLLNTIKSNPLSGAVKEGVLASIAKRLS